MAKILPTALIVGVVAGLLVGVFNIFFVVPVENRAIDLEEQRSAEEAGGVVAEEKPLVPVWVQSYVGEPIFMAIFGLFVGAIFAGGYNLGRRAFPDWHPALLAIVMGAVGFWTMAFVPYIKYPINPPGVGQAETLLFRQALQLLLFVLSVAGTAGVLVALQRINSTIAPGQQRRQKYGIVGISYALFIAILLIGLPGNPDPVPVPIDMVELFRTLGMIGHFLHWMLVGLGVALVIMWKQRSSQSSVSSRMAPSVSTQ